MAVVVNVYGKANLDQIKRAEKQLAGMRRQVQAQQPAWKRWGSSVNAASNAAAVGLAGLSGLAYKGVKSYEELTNSIANLKRQSDISAEDASLLVGQWQRYGVSVEAGTKATTMLSKAIYSVNSGSKAGAETAKAFAAVGVSMADLKTKSPAQILEQVRSALSEMPAGAERTALASKLMGRGFQSLSKWLAASQSDIQGLNQTLSETGQVMDEAELAKAKKQMKEQADMAVEWRGIMLQVGRAAMPIMKSLTKVLSRAMELLQPFADKLGYLAAGLAAFIGISKTVKAIKGVTDGIKGVSSALRGARAAEGSAKGLGAALSKLKVPAAALKRVGSSIATGIGDAFKAASGKLRPLIQAGVSKAASGVKVAVNVATSVGTKVVGAVADTAATVANTAAKTANAVATNVAAAAQWLWNAALAANPIGIIVVAIIALVAIFVVLWKKCAWFRNFWKAVWGEIVTIAKAVWNWMKPGIEAIWKGIKVVWDAIWKATQWVWSKIGPFVVAYVKTLWTGLKFWFGVIKTVVTKVWDGLVAVTRKVWPVVLFIVRGVVTNIKTTVAVLKVVLGIVKAAWNGIVAVTRAVWGVVKTVVGAAVKGVVTAVHVLDKVREVVRRVWQKVADVTRAIWDALKGVVGAAIDWMWDKITGIWGKVKGVYDKVKGWITGGSSPSAGRGGRGPRKFGAGGYVPPTPGGVAAILAERGEGEYVVRESQAGRFARTMLGQQAQAPVQRIVVEKKVALTWQTLTGEPSQREKQRLAGWLKPELDGMGNGRAATGW